MVDKHLCDKVLKGVREGETQIQCNKVSLLMGQAIIISLASILTFDSWMIETVGVLMRVRLQLCLSRLQHRFEYIP